MDVDELRAAAVRYCAAGWPIVPVCPMTDRFVSERSPADPEVAREWWADRPYGIACRTGVVFDALPLPRWLGERVLPAVEHLAAVIEIQRPTECGWWFLVTPGSPAIQDLALVVTGVRLHGRGGMVSLPPSPLTRWVVRQQELRLPHSLTVQWAAVRAVIAARRAARTATDRDGQG